MKKKYCRDPSFQITMTLPIVRETSGVKMRSPEDVYRHCRDIQLVAQEVFQVLIIDSKHNMIDRITASIGTIDATVVHPRDVFRAAIHMNGHSIILVHNHPSGDPTPSAEDVLITRQITEAGKIVGIQVQDHVVIGRARIEGEKSFTSMRECGLGSFV